jgi:predicted phosphoribosyltransferase
LIIGYWYQHFEQISGEKVADLIERSRGAKVGESNDTDT